MKSRYRQIPNVITVLRILFSVIIPWTVPFSVPFYGLYTLAGLSDIVDGALARYLHAASAIGSTLDTLADAVMVTAVGISIAETRAIPLWLWLWIGILFLWRIGNAVYGKRKEGRYVFLHTKANKITGLSLFLYVYVCRYVPVLPMTVLLCLLATYATGDETRIFRSQPKKREKTML